jgi:phosphotransferase system HPr-like phosphotransfer protein
MVGKTVTVKHIYGIDPGLISYIIRTAQHFKSVITIENISSGRRADARELNQLFNLNTGYGEEIMIEAEGVDEDLAVEIMNKTINIFENRKIYDNNETDLQIEQEFNELENKIENELRI